MLRDCSPCVQQWATSKEQVQHKNWMLLVPFSLCHGRNVLVGDGLSCVVADFGMSRALAKDDSYYQMTSKNRLPVKWMALEAIEYRKYSTYSDGELCEWHARQWCGYRHACTHVTCTFIPVWVGGHLYVCLYSMCVCELVCSEDVSELEYVTVYVDECARDCTCSSVTHLHEE